MVHLGPANKTTNKKKLQDPDYIYLGPISLVTDEYRSNIRWLSAVWNPDVSIKISRALVYSRQANVTCNIQI